MEKMCIQTHRSDKQIKSQHAHRLEAVIWTTTTNLLKTHTFHESLRLHCGFFHRTLDILSAEM